MCRLARVARFLVFFAVHVALLSCQASFALPPAKEKWIRVRSNHFEIIGNAQPHVAEDVALQFEHFRAFMEMGEPARESVPPIKVFLFKNEDSFAPYKRSPNGEVYNFIGVFNDTPYGVYIAMRADLEEETFQVVYHEYVHYYFSRKPVAIPLWLHEGMAEYLSTFKSNGKKVLLGEPIPAHLETLRRIPWMALGDLFKADLSSPEYNEAERQSLFYAQSWAFLHYMRHARPDLYANLNRLVQALNEGKSTLDAFEQAYGIDYSRFVKGMHEYFRSGRPRYFEVDISALHVDEALHVENLPYHEVLSNLGTYLADASPWDERAATEHLSEALRMDPDRAEPHAVLGTVLEGAGRHVDAKEHFERAIDLAPGDDVPLYRYGISRMQSFMDDHPLAQHLPADLPQEMQEARQLLALALQVNPLRTEAYVACGYTYLFESEDAAEGARLMQYAHDLMPHRMDVVFYLVTLYLRLGQREKAESLFLEAPVDVEQYPWYVAALQALGRSVHEQPTRRASASMGIEQFIRTLDRSRLESIDAHWRRFEEARRAYDARNYDSCLSILRELSKLPIDDALQDQVESLQDLAEDQQIGVRQAQTYNRAAQKVRQRKYTEAASILEKLLRERIRDPSLEKTARDLLERLPH
jgi:tetratricopeptide (TPR) repeat protein